MLGCAPAVAKAAKAVGQKVALQQGLDEEGAESEDEEDDVERRLLWGANKRAYHGADEVQLDALVLCCRRLALPPLPLSSDKRKCWVPHCNTRDTARYVRESRLVCTTTGSSQAATVSFLACRRTMKKRPRKRRRRRCGCSVSSRRRCGPRTMMTHTCSLVGCSCNPGVPAHTQDAADADGICDRGGVSRHHNVHA